MMGVTHGLVGAVFAFPFVLLYPELATPLILAGYLGGLFPDVDLFVGTHRKTLHFPVYFAVLAGVTGLIGALATLPRVLVVSVFFCGAAIHSWSDIAGAGVELRPWERTDTRAVYLHAQNRWITARYWIPYDGSPLDLFLVALLAGLVYIIYPTTPVVGVLIVGSIGVGGVYTGVRRKLPALKEYLEGVLPVYPQFFP